MKEWKEKLMRAEESYECMENLKRMVMTDKEGVVPRSCKDELEKAIHGVQVQLEVVMKCLAYTVKFRKIYPVFPAPAKEEEK